MGVGAMKGKAKDQKKTGGGPGRPIGTGSGVKGQVLSPTGLLWVCGLIMLRAGTWDDEIE